MIKVVVADETGSPWPQRRTRSKGDERHELIYETAARLFHEKGYGATSLQDLATAVGLQKGSLYHYIESKEDLLFGIVEYTHRFFVDVLERTVDPERPPLEEIGAIVHAHALFAVENFHITSAFYNDRSALSVERRRAVTRTRDAYEAKIAGLIRDGQERGEIATDLDPRLSALGLLGMLNSIQLRHRLGDHMTPDAVADEFSRLCVRSLRPG